MSRPPSFERASTAVVLLLLAGACSSPDRGPAVPEDQGERATVFGMPGLIRTWSDKVSDEFLEEITRAQARRTVASDSVAGPPAVELLAISGGGPRGAYG